jgi:GT2 family glycosyltransferase
MNVEKNIRVVCATRVTQAEFPRTTALGRSLSLLRATGKYQLQLYPSNSAGLPTVYNDAIRTALDNPAILVFAHDDVHLCDFFWIERIRAALERFDVVGVAGNRRRVPKQPAWAFVDEKFTWDSRENLSGSVGHGRGFPCASLSVFGASGQECKLLDGVVLIADSGTLKARELRFDPAFAFHFYDMDFCRQAELKGLRMGTWPLSIVHESGGAFGTPVWIEAYRKYLAKYGD